MLRILLLILFTCTLTCKESTQKKNVSTVKTDTTATNEVQIVQDRESIAAGKDYDNLGEKIETILFEVKSVKTSGYKNGIKSWVDIAHPENDLPNLIKKDEIVIRENRIKVLIDYPLTNAYSFDLTSSNGFSREELLRAISEHYYKVFAEEEQTATVKTIPVEKRTKIYNRNQTNGKYGIWGHDIADLVLADIIVYRVAGKNLLLVLDIES
jgi:hypothetical protein